MSENLKKWDNSGQKCFYVCALPSLPCAFHAHDMNRSHSIENVQSLCDDSRIFSFLYHVAVRDFPLFLRFLSELWALFSILASGSSQFFRGGMGVHKKTLSHVLCKKISRRERKILSIFVLFREDFSRFLQKGFENHPLFHPMTTWSHSTSPQTYIVYKSRLQSAVLLKESENVVGIKMKKLWKFPLSKLWANLSKSTGGSAKFSFFNISPTFQIINMTRSYSQSQTEEHPSSKTSSNVRLKFKLIKLKIKLKF